MILDKDIEIIDYILSQNTYFAKGYSRVVKDKAIGIIRSGESEKNKKNIVFPNDTLGNYFYLRTEKEYQGVYTDGLNLSQDIKLVCIVKDADKDTLAANLLVTLKDMTCKIGGNVRVKEVQTDAPTVTYDELSGIENVEAALNRINDTIISITFNYTYRFTPICIKDPKICL